jgi:hypothetical protein
MLTTTFVWLVVSIQSGDITHIRNAFLDKDAAMDALIDHIDENVRRNDVWFKLIPFEAPRILERGRQIYVVVDIYDDDAIHFKVHDIHDQLEAISEDIRNADDYWIEDVELN